MRSGIIAALDRDTGKTLWRTHVGNPYQPSHPVGWNAKSVFVAQGTWLYALDRGMGTLQWRYNMPDAASSGPAADDEQLYISLGSGRFNVYLLPPISRRELALTGIAANKLYLPQVEIKVERPANFYGGSSGTTQGIGPLSSVLQATRTEGVGQQPIFRWDFRAPSELEQQPLLGSVDLLWAGANGSVITMPKQTETPGRPFRFPTDGRISASPGQYGELAYVGSHDGNVYALHIPSGRLLWRFAGASPIIQKPAVTNEDVYVSPREGGLYRIDRATGQTQWKNPTAWRFLANNPKFVYAADRHGRLLILDRARGTSIAVHDGTRDYVVPVANEATDRIFLAANDGLLVCLHDRDYSEPVAMKEDDEKLVLPPPGPGGRTPGKPDRMPGKPPMMDKPGGPGMEKPGMEKPGDGMMGKPPGPGMEKPKP
jgi:outer membrane protein assembly factor BamB